MNKQNKKGIKKRKNIKAKLFAFILLISFMIIDKVGFSQIPAGQEDKLDCSHLSAIISDSLFESHMSSGLFEIDKYYIVDTFNIFHCKKSLTMHKSKVIVIHSYPEVLNKSVEAFKSLRNKNYNLIVLQAIKYTEDTLKLNFWNANYNSTLKLSVSLQSSKKIKIQLISYGAY